MQANMKDEEKIRKVLQKYLVNVSYILKDCEQNSFNARTNKAELKQITKTANTLFYDLHGAAYKWRENTREMRKLFTQLKHLKL